MASTRVLLGDDHALILEGMRRSLGSRFEIVGEATDGRALLRAAEQTHPDVVVLDISMPVLNGFETARQLRALLPGARLVFVSQHRDPAYLRQALKIGVSAYVLKTEACEELQRAVDAAVRGETYISSSFGEEVLAQLWGRTRELNQESGELTERQRQILQLVVEGHSNKEIADLLHLSIKTVEFHRARLMSKMGVRSAAELAKAALQRGLIPG